MRELVGHNRALKGELRKWTADGLGMLPAGRASKPPRPSAGGGRLAGGSATARHNLEGSAQAPRTAATLVGSSALGNTRADSGPPRSAESRFDEADAEFADTDGEGGALLDGGDDDLDDDDDWMRDSIGSREAAGTGLGPQASIAPAAAEASGCGQSTASRGVDGPRHRARARLEEAKQSLSLAGSTPALFERPPALGATQRGTQSQSKARKV